MKWISLLFAISLINLFVSYFVSWFSLLIIGISLFLEQKPPRQFSFIYKTPNYFLFGPRCLSGTVQLHEQKFQRQCFAPSSHLISTETGNAAETSCKNKSKFAVKTALQVHPLDFISPLVSGRSSVKVAREAGRSWITQENATTISSFSSTCSTTVSCRRIYSTFQCLVSAPFFVSIALNITDTRLTRTPRWCRQVPLSPRKVHINPLITETR